jgi:hypothetical protein
MQPGKLSPPAPGPCNSLGDGTCLFSAHIMVWPPLERAVSRVWPFLVIAESWWRRAHGGLLCALVEWHKWALGVWTSGDNGPALCCEWLRTNVSRSSSVQKDVKSTWAGDT